MVQSQAGLGGIHVKYGSSGFSVTGLGQTSLFFGSEKWIMIVTCPGRSRRCWYGRFLTTNR